jgi:L-ascorbate metabolism protein UlaG (beta-lactamase superfamily)
VQLPASNIKILVDPWLVGKLTFGGANWFFEGEKPGLKRDGINIDKLTADIDFILLAQSLDDHFHKPTLAVLPKHIPVVAAAEAAKMAQEFGFETIHSIDHGQTVRLTRRAAA